MDTSQYPGDSCRVIPGDGCRVALTDTFESFEHDDPRGHRGVGSEALRQPYRQTRCPVLIEIDLVVPVAGWVPDLDDAVGRATVGQLNLDHRSFTGTAEFVSDDDRVRGGDDVDRLEELRERLACRDIRKRHIGNRTELIARPSETTPVHSVGHGI
jgi:hypothetical protein